MPIDKVHPVSNPDLLSSGKVLDNLRLTGEILRAAQHKKDVLNFAIRILLKIGFDRVRIWLVDEESQEYRGAKASHLSDKEFQKAHSKFNAKILPSHYVDYLKLRRPYVNKKMPLLKKFFHDYKAPYSIEFPLLSGKHLLGMVSVDNAFSRREIPLSEAETLIMPFINQIALTLYRVASEQKIRKINETLRNKVSAATAELKKRNAELHYLASHDTLTGLPNRRDFEKKLRAEFERANEKHPLVLGILDIDFLKQVNDQKGHLAGDKLIATIGRILREQKTFYAARLAGDEFVLLSRGRKCASPCPLKSLKDKIKKATGQSVSIGVAIYPGSNIYAPLDLIRVADDNLYHAKHTGRGRFICSRQHTIEKIVPLAKRQEEMRLIEKSGLPANDYIHQLEILKESSSQFQSAKNEKDIIRKVLNIFQKRFALLKIQICELDHVTKQIHCLYGVNTPQSFACFTRQLNAEKNFITQATLTHKVSDITDLAKQKRAGRAVKNLLGTPSGIVVPLINKNRAIGFILIGYDHRQIQFSPSDHNFFLALGHQIALALTQAHLLSEVKNFNQQLTKKVGVATKKLRAYSRSLEQKIKDNERLRIAEEATQFEAIAALATSLDAKDDYTRGHSARVAFLAVRLGRAVGLAKNELVDLRHASLLHDLGKLSIDQNILEKHTALTPEEVKALSQHPIIGAKIVSSMRFLRHAAVFIRHHHERWDGHGYPDHIGGEKIPLASRIINIADAYDAMVSRRSYGHKMTHQEAIAELKIDAGRQFDPHLTKIFVRLAKKGFSQG